VKNLNCGEWEGEESEKSEACEACEERESERRKGNWEAKGKQKLQEVKEKQKLQETKEKQSQFKKSPIYSPPLTPLQFPLSPQNFVEK